MSTAITISKTKNSRLPSLDFNNIPFGSIFSDHMFVADYVDGEWVDARIIPCEAMLLHPGNMALHYGQSIFEGMKATINEQGTPLLFRPEMHVERLNASARRMCMAEVPEELFLDGLNALVYLEKDWIPPFDGSALYLRPFLFASDEALGVRPSQKYRFIILTLPVGPYYSQPVKLKAEEKYIRAAHGGVGEAKTAGNYAASLLPVELARKEGFDQVIWLDGKEFKYIQEVGTMNIFFVIDGKVITPATDGSILKGITRDTALQVLKDAGYTVEVRKVTMDEVMEAGRNGLLTEVFGTGTAAVIAPVKQLRYKGEDVFIDADSFTVAPFIKKTITGIRSQKLPDVHNWVQEIHEEVVSA